MEIYIDTDSKQVKIKRAKSQHEVLVHLKKLFPMEWREYSIESLGNSVCIGSKAGRNITTATNCTFIGIEAGRDVMEGDGLVIIGDYIHDFSPRPDVFSLNDRIAIGKTLFGKEINLVDVVKEIINELIPKMTTTQKPIEDINDALANAAASIFPSLNN